MTTNLFPALLKALQPENGVDALYTNAVPLREYADIVQFGVGHVLVVDDSTEVI